jgi:NAD(P)-dependent dehydrogenase (short-subunit alcohol dehydrogenase family)
MTATGPTTATTAVAGIEGRVALVTGAATGIGRASAHAFAAAGAAVAVVDVDGEGAAAVAAEIAAAGAEAGAFPCDLTDEDQVAALVAAVVARFGRLDLAHNNAGISPVTGGVVDCPRDLWDAVLAVNLTGVWLGMKHQIPAMLATGGGAIVNTASGNVAKTTKASPAYIASKHGVVGITRSAALELADQGVRVNAISPGATRTAMVESKVAQGAYTWEAMSGASPMGRLAEPAEIAAAAVWLCSDAASFVTGSVLSVDGGTTLG